MSLPVSWMCSGYAAGCRVEIDADQCMPHAVGTIEVEGHVAAERRGCQRLVGRSIDAHANNTSLIDRGWGE